MKQDGYRAFVVHAMLVGCALVALETEAQASPDYPAALQQALDREFPAVKHCAPLCSACHNTTQGGPGNINPFGATLIRFGLEQSNAALVPLAVHALATADPIPDTDDDGSNDIDELNRGDSPSIAGPAGTSQFCPDIAYGCGARVALGPLPARMSFVAAAALGLGLLARRRRRPLARSRG